MYSMPPEITPTSYEEIELPSGSLVKIQKATPHFNLWTDELPQDTYGGKSILNVNGKPAFAELAILQLFLSEGWTGVWVDTFRRKYRTTYWPKNEISLPPIRQQLMERIFVQANSRKGCWDIFCWKEDCYLFAEAKKKAHDMIRESQRCWLEAATKCGLPLSSFLIVEWTAS